jgi:hypothetical protein
MGSKLPQDGRTIEEIVQNHRKYYHNGWIQGAELGATSRSHQRETVIMAMTNERTPGTER